jgi:hypothetical protein
MGTHAYDRQRTDSLRKHGYVAGSDCKSPHRVHLIRSIYNTHGALANAHAVIHDGDNGGAII